MIRNKPTPKRLALLLVGCLLGGYFLWAGFRKVDWGQSLATLSKADVKWILAGLLCLAADYSLRVVRWWLMLRVSKPELKVQACIPPFMGSIALNNLLPFRSGDVARVFAYSKTVGPPAVVLGSVLLERALDLVTLLVIFFIGLSGAAASAVPLAFVKTSKYFLVACIVAFVFLMAAPLFRKPLDAAFHRSEKAKTSRVVAFGRQFYDSISKYQKGWLMPSLVGLSAVIWLFEGGLFWCVGHSLSIPVTTNGALFALGIGTLGTLLPSTPGYIGVFDFFVKSGFVAYGASLDTAAVCALLLHTLLYVSLTIVGGVCLLLQYGKPHGVIETPTEEKEIVS